MKQESLISVIMPVYNGEKYLSEAIESILNQTYRNFEFLIINDGSTDTSEEIICSYTDPRIFYLKNDKNRGLVYTLNYGISVARGEYIARMDADDISFPHRFEKQIEAFDIDSDLGLCGTWAKVIGSNTILKVETEHERIKCGLFFTNQFIHSSVMLRKDILIELGNYYDENNFPAEDYGLWIELSCKIKLVNIPLILIEYRVHPTQISTFRSEKQKQLTHSLRLKQIINFLSYEPSREESKIHRLIFDNKLEISTLSELNLIYCWLSKLKLLNEHCSYYNRDLLRTFINKYLEERILTQNYKDNNPIFMAKFYVFYFKHEYRFNNNFHLKFIIKCLIFYTPTK